jgi:hypothetical protein
MDLTSKLDLVQTPNFNQNIPQSNSQPSSFSSSSHIDTSKMSPQELDSVLAQIPMPSGWQKAFTSTGETYFINHNSKSTCWEDPRLPLVSSFLQNRNTLTAQQQFDKNYIEILKNNLVESIRKKNELLKVLQELNKKVILFYFYELNKIKLSKCIYF